MAGNESPIGLIKINNKKFVFEEVSKFYGNLLNNLLYIISGTYSYGEIKCEPSKNESVKEFAQSAYSNCKQRKKILSTILELLEKVEKKSYELSASDQADIEDTFESLTNKFSDEFDSLKIKKFKEIKNKTNEDVKEFKQELAKQINYLIREDFDELKQNPELLMPSEYKITEFSFIPTKILITT